MDVSKIGVQPGYQASNRFSYGSRIFMCASLVVYYQVKEILTDHLDM